ncbi:DNA (cytosine-5)-methyltransferase 3B [Cephus cinctus]|uniref:DNA (cytosine-5-)-methyltransferase n=1 Tax=Cephus cinctus TaxID=211228 RepID=A0AAJ7BU06_CEPCN|nr:DNA (cytosine-5)-methyltransferase 3B [Cephus cinctus]
MPGPRKRRRRLFGRWKASASIKIDRSNSRKSWPGSSVWSTVCAIELGLIKDDSHRRTFPLVDESSSKISSPRRAGSSFSSWTHDFPDNNNNASTAFIETPNYSIKVQDEEWGLLGKPDYYIAKERPQEEPKVLARSEIIAELGKVDNEGKRTRGSRPTETGGSQVIPNGGDRDPTQKNVKTACRSKKTRSASQKTAEESNGRFVERSGAEKENRQAGETGESIGDGHKGEAASAEKPEGGGKISKRVLKDNGQPGARGPRRSSSVARAETWSSGSAPTRMEIDNRERTIGNEKYDGRPLTRGQMRNALRIEKPCRLVSGASSEVGRLVWGYCMGWWPALIVDAEHVGMVATPEKLWVYWIGESRISQLRAKSQVEPFSQNLKSRLIDHLRNKAATKARTIASVATLKLLAEKLKILLTRPYCSWAEREVVPLKASELNGMSFYPYPCDVEEDLENLRKENIRANEAYLLDVEKKKMKEEQQQKQIISTASPKENQPQKSTSASGKVSSTATTASVRLPEEHLALADQKPGVIAWAKIPGHAWWPAMIVDHRDAGMDEPNFGCQWIIWYGDYKLSQVNHRDFMAFDLGFEKVREYTVQAKRVSYVAGVLDASKDYCSRLGYKTDHWKLTDVLGWFSRTNSHSKCRRVIEAADDLPGITGLNDNQLKYTERILKKLQEFKGDRKVAALRESAIERTGLASEEVDAAELLKRSCLVCLEILRDGNCQEHPFFEGSVCDECMELYKPSMFAYGDDGKCYFCTLCAGTDTVVMCDAHDCPRVYCTACLKYLISPYTYRAILLEDPWLCFFCKDDARLASDGFLKFRCDWKERILRLFHRNNEFLYWDLPPSVDTTRRKMRVLSLFDGLSTGLLVLRKLGIKVECYYASEIDPDAEAVSVAHFGDRIIRLGDVRNITRETINDIGPIDLLIGGSPCNDLSLANPYRLGLHDPKGTGILFFEYCRVLKLLNETNGDRQCFWLFENVASMPSKYRLEINAHLGREPDFVDSADFSAQHRPRLYWSNLPIVSQHSLDTQDLQDVLTPNCNRQALVKKIQTVTTRVNSLKQGKALCKPVLMNNREDSIWITELEEIFGFPRHFTDVKNLSVTKRQKLIGKSWSVQTLTAILRPLRYFFEITEIEP